jgi:hypothetical protein
MASSPSPPPGMLVSRDSESISTETGTRGSNLTPQASNPVNVPSVDNIQQQQQTEDDHVDTISNIVQNVDEEDLGSMFGSGRGQGGIDLSRMMQQMMPAVSQVLGGAGVRPTSANSEEPRSQPQHSDSGEGNNLDGRSSSQINVQQACRIIEDHESPENILDAVLETAAQAYGEDDSI